MSSVCHSKVFIRKLFFMNICRHENYLTLYIKISKISMYDFWLISGASTIVFIKKIFIFLFRDSKVYTIVTPLSYIYLTGWLVDMVYTLKKIANSTYNFICAVKAGFDATTQIISISKQDFVTTHSFIYTISYVENSMKSPYILSSFWIRNNAEASICCCLFLRKFL